MNFPISAFNEILSNEIHGKYRMRCDDERKNYMITFLLMANSRYVFAKKKKKKCYRKYLTIVRMPFNP